MAQDEQLVTVRDRQKPGRRPVAQTKLRLGRLKFMEELSAQQATVDQAWQRVERAVSAFSPFPGMPAR